jgi:hypothetical protein
MRAEKNRLKRAVAALAPAQNVSGDINSRLEARRSHQLHGVLSASDIRIRISHPADAIGEGAASGASVNAQPFQALLQSGSVDAQRGNITLCESQVSEGRSDRRGGQSGEQFATSDSHAGIVNHSPISARSRSECERWRVRLNVVAAMRDRFNRQRSATAISCIGVENLQPFPESLTNSSFRLSQR